MLKDYNNVTKIKESLARARHKLKTNCLYTNNAKYKIQNLFKNYFYCFYNMYVSVYRYVCACKKRCQRSEATGAGITGACEPLSMGARNSTWIVCSLPLSHLSRPKILNFKTSFYFGLKNIIHVKTN